jgi:hypothetical protein
MMLYLDKDLVKLAQDLKLPLSQITESAIKTHAFPRLSYGERAKLDFEEYLTNLEDDMSCFFLPFSISKVSLKNVGPFKEAEVAFKEGLNVVVGNNGSGKTTLIRAIAEAFGLTGGDFTTSVLNKNGIMKIWINNKELVVRYAEENGKSVQQEGVKCILLDSPIERFNPNVRDLFLRWLKKNYKCQVVLVVHNNEFTPDMAKKYGANIVDLSDYASKRGKT